MQPVLSVHFPFATDINQSTKIKFRQLNTRMYNTNMWNSILKIYVLVDYLIKRTGKSSLVNGTIYKHNVLMLCYFHLFHQENDIRFKLKI